MEIRWLFIFSRILRIEIFIYKLIAYSLKSFQNPICLGKHVLQIEIYYKALIKATYRFLHPTCSRIYKTLMRSPFSQFHASSDDFLALMAFYFFWPPASGRIVISEENAVIETKLVRINIEKQFYHLWLVCLNIYFIYL